MLFLSLRISDFWETLIQAFPRAKTAARSTFRRDFLHILPVHIVRRCVFLVLCCLLCISRPWICTGTEDTKTTEEWKKLYARSAVLMDGGSGRILVGKNENEVLPMASTTKIMTCILALELAGEDEICKVSQYAASQPQVRLGMKTGECYLLGDLLFSMMLESHNDSAVCIAECVGGDVRSFAKLMNRKAREIGCRNTHYITPNGLDEEDAQGIHSTTARDLALVMRYCTSLSERADRFREITGTMYYQFRDLSGNRIFQCTNHNALLGMMEGAFSGKTGYTSKAGYCYVGALQREDTVLIVTLLACGWPGNKTWKWSDTKKLAEYGFSHYKKVYPRLEEISFPDIAILRGEKDHARVELGQGTEASNPPYQVLHSEAGILMREDEKLYLQTGLAKAVPAPVKAGDPAGMVILKIGETEYARIPVCFAETVKRKTFWFCLRKIWDVF